jgi:undecaprenyl-diphosphatase
MYEALYEMDIHLFRNINKYFQVKALNHFFKTITHLGGATISITTVLLIIILSQSTLQLTAIASATALAFSHLPVAIMKKMYPRSRPYLSLKEIHVLANPLRDHSFPSGHTTAIFSITIPFIMYMPPLGALLLPLAILVGVSRIFLGLHYPSDVLAGSILGSLVAMISYEFIHYMF